MTRATVRWLVVGVVGVVALAAVIALLVRPAQRPTAPAAEETVFDPSQGPVPLPEGSGWQVELYFPGQDRRLHAETRELAIPEEPRQAIALVVSALLAGPERAELRTPLPAGTRLLGVWVDERESLAWIDLGGEGAPEQPSTGSAAELLAVYSLVNSVALNVEGIEQVSLLWNGTQGSSFAGHVDTTHPLRANRSYLARG